MSVKVKIKVKNVMEDIEKVVFQEIGGYNYKLEEIKGLHPLSNVYGFVKIRDKYYQKVFI